MDAQLTQQREEEGTGISINSLCHFQKSDDCGLSVPLCASVVYFSRFPYDCKVELPKLDFLSI
jgi:hypothetical protein